jgi:hypothetical protein
MTHDPTRDCEHGRLKGKCDVCDLQAEVERLNRVNAELQNKLQGKRAIFQAGRDSYQTSCAPYNSDDEAWDAFINAKATGETK